MAERRHPDLDVGGPGVQGGSAARCPFCEAQPGQAVTATEAQAETHRAHKIARRPLMVNGKPIPSEIINGPPGDFARYCGATDPDVLALLDAEADDA